MVSKAARDHIHKRRERREAVSRVPFDIMVVSGVPPFGLNSAICQAMPRRRASGLGMAGGEGCRTMPSFSTSTRASG